MLIIKIIILTILTKIVFQQNIEIQNINDNNGYVTIKLDDLRLINSYTKILHVVNITEYQYTRDKIYKNIKIIKRKAKLMKPMLNTLLHNFNQLNQTIENLVPHSRHKRSLFDILGTSLKYIAGTMDANDEKEINEKLENLSRDNKNLIEESNKQIILNNQLINQIKNLTSYINHQQFNISGYLETFYQNYETNFIKIEEKLLYIQYIYQINYDISLLKSHLEDIEQIILTSKLGILSRNILTEEEYKFITDIETLKDIKIIVAYKLNQIIIIILIPQYSENKFSKVLIEPIPDKNNKSIFLDNYTVIIDNNNSIYSSKINENLIKNLVPIEDKCINNIFKFKNAKCNKQLFKNPQIIEILPGVVITKNLHKINLIQNCNNYQDLYLVGTNIIKFDNCQINLNKTIYDNKYTKINDNIILPHFITDIVEDKLVHNIKFEEIHLNEINNNRKLIIESKDQYKKEIIVNYSFKTIIVILILIIVILYILKIKIKTKNKNISSEPQSRGGGVISNNDIELNSNIF